MSAIYESSTAILTTDLAITNNTSSIIDYEVDFRKNVGGMIQAQITFATAPTENTAIDVYVLPSITSEGTFDGYSQGRNIYLGSIRVANTTSAQILSISINNIVIPYGKIALYNNGTGQTATVNNMTVCLRKIG